jgi:hypothetical protein
MEVVLGFLIVCFVKVELILLLWEVQAYLHAGNVRQVNIPQILE